MRRVFTVFLCSAALCVAATAAANADPAAKQKCKVAEVNPVSGNAVCINPFGAPVTQPKQGPKACQGKVHAQGGWTFGSECKH